MEKPTDLDLRQVRPPMVIKWGKHGSFLACTGYPECTNTRELPADLPDVENGEFTEQEAKRSTARTAAARWC
jgi:DNA topoisomerase I